MITLPLRPKARVAALVHTIKNCGLVGPIPGATFVSPFQSVFSLSHCTVYVCPVSGSYRTLYSLRTYYGRTAIYSSSRKDWYCVAPQDPRKVYGQPLVESAGVENEEFIEE